MSDKEWIQDTLQISKGGLGIQRTTDIALPSVLASVYGCRNLVYYTLYVKGEQVIIETWQALNKKKFLTILNIQRN